MPIDDLKRRQFVTLLGGAAAWPFAARAQQGERMRRIGVLINVTSITPASQIQIAAFQQGLQEAGWSVGRNAEQCRPRVAAIDQYRATTGAAQSNL
jgi:hypothetical protein